MDINLEKLLNKKGFDFFHLP